GSLIGRAGRTLPVDAVQMSSASLATRSELRRRTVRPTQPPSCWAARPAHPADGRPAAAPIVLGAAAGSAVLAALASHLGPPPAGRSALSTRPRSGPRRRRRRVPPTPPRPRPRDRPPD